MAEKQKREIWFRTSKVAFLPVAAWPVHWKGFLSISIMLGAALLWMLLLNVMHVNLVHSNLAFPGLVAIIVVFFGIAAMHSE